MPFFICIIIDQWALKSKKRKKGGRKNTQACHEDFADKSPKGLTILLFRNLFFSLAFFHEIKKNKQDSLKYQLSLTYKTKSLNEGP